MRVQIDVPCSTEFAHVERIFNVPVVLQPAAREKLAGHAETECVGVEFTWWVGG